MECVVTVDQDLISDSFSDFFPAFSAPKFCHTTSVSCRHCLACEVSLASLIVQNTFRARDASLRVEHFSLAVRLVVATGCWVLHQLGICVGVSRLHTTAVDRATSFRVLWLVGELGHKCGAPHKLPVSGHSVSSGARTLVHGIRLV